MYYVEAVIDKKLFSDLAFRSRVDIKVKVNSNARRFHEYNVCPIILFVVIADDKDLVQSPVASNREKLIRAFGVKVGSVRLSVHLDKRLFYAGMRQ